MDERMRKLMPVAMLLLVALVVYLLVVVFSGSKNSDNPLLSGKEAVQQQDYDAAADWFRQAAELGVAEAQFRYGMLFRSGQGVDQDDEQAVRWLQLSAQQGYTDAAYELAVLLELGRGVEGESAASAKKWFTKAAEAGHAGAALHLAVIYAKGRGVPASDKQAVTWAAKAAAGGLSEATAFLQQLMNRLTGKAKAGDAEAQYLLAMLSLHARQADHAQADSGQAEIWLRQSAGTGKADAQFQLAEVLMSRHEAAADSEAAVWYQKAANQKHMPSAAVLGALYAQGRGVDLDAKQARYWLELAAQAGIARAQANLGILSAEKGLDDEADLWLKKAADGKLDDAKNNLAVMYLYGRGVKQDTQQALELLHQAADSDALAQYNLALVYLHGIGTIQNDEGALEWLHKAEANGNSDARLILGLLYDLGRGTVSSNKQAIHWYELAMRSGSDNAGFNLAALYYRQGDMAEGFKLFMRAAQAGDVVAENIVASMYEHGEGVDASFKQALNWYEKAALAGNPRASFNLANLFRKGEGVTQQDSKALFWYRKAAESGFAQAQNSLAYMYALGRGVKPDSSIARHWFEQAVDQGLAIAVQNLSLLDQHAYRFTLATHAVEVNRRDQILTEKPFNPSHLQMHHQLIIKY